MDYLETSKEAWKRAGDFPPNKEEVYPEHKLVQEFDLHTKKKVLEYGCGGGSDAISYLRRGNFVTACDIVPDNIASAKKRITLYGLSERADLCLLENSVPIPYPDSTFDLVNSHGVLHHIRNIHDVMDELHRVIKPDGLIYIMLYTNYMWDYFEDQINLLVEKYGIDKYEAFCWCADGQGTPYARCYSEEEGCELLEQHGFYVENHTLWLNDHFCTYKAKAVK